MSMTELLAISLTVAVIAMGISLIFLLLDRRRGSDSSLTVSFSLERIREMGELVALNAFVKEVVTQTTNEKSFFSTTGKILMICEFDVEFRFDLRKSKISNQNGVVQIHLPEHYAKIIPKEHRIYDEKKSSYFGVVGVDFSLELRNELTEAAKRTAVAQAGILKEDLRERVQASAISTLSAMAYGMGAKGVEVTFDTAGNVVPLTVVHEAKQAA